MKNIILLFIALLLVLTGCKKEPNGGLSESERNASLVFDRADISGAEYLAVIQTSAPKSKSTTDDRNIIKIDKDGNMTAVVFYMTYTKDPVTGKPIAGSELRTDVKVIPNQIVSFGGVYTYLASCSFVDNNGKLIFPSAYYKAGPISERVGFLIRNSDGAVFYSEDAMMLLNQIIPLTHGNTNSDLNTISFDKNNDMYFSTSSDRFPKGKIYKLTLQSERDLSIKEVTPAGMESRSFVLSNTQGVLIVGDVKDGIYNSSGNNFTFYPNGGFEQINSDKILCATGNLFKFFSQERSYDEQTAQEIIKTTITSLEVSNRPPLSSAIEAQISMSYDPSSAPDHFSPSYSIDCKNHYVIGGEQGYNYKPQLFTIDKSSKKIQILSPEKFPMARYTYATNYPDRVGNTIFSIDGNTKTIQSYNFETLQYREVQYDDSELGGFFEKGTSFKNDPPTYIKYGTRGSDGKPVTVEINIETGATNVKVDPDNRETIILVRIS